VRLMLPDSWMLFDKMPQSLSLYQALERAVLERVPEATVRVSKTQVSFCSPRVFACTSFNPCRPAAQRPPVWLTVTFGLGAKKQSPRIDVATEPYPGRWTHHLMIGSADEIDDELLDWIAEAAVFAADKRRRTKA